MTSVLYFFHYIVSITIVFFSFLGFGSIIKNYFYKDFFFKFLVGYFLIGLLTLLIHFFSPINTFVSIILVCIGLILFFINFRDFNTKELINLLFIYILSSMLLIFYSDHPIDTNMYHHPYVSYLNSEKIIFGVANVQFRFGHISFLQYAQASLINDYLHILNLSAPNILLYVLFLYFCGKSIFQTKNINFNLLLIILLSSFLLIKYGRYREFGNDLIPMIVSFYFLIKIVDEILLTKNENIKLFNLFPLYVIFIFSHKIPFILSSLIFLAVFKFKKINLININKFCVFIFLLFSFLWFSKNFINTSCFAYPLPKSCIEQTNWKLSGLSDPKSASYLTEIWSKDFITNPNWKELNLPEYINNFNWVKNWLKNHFIKILEKLSPVFILLIYLFTLGIIFRNNNQIRKSNKKLYFICFLIFCGGIVWFINAPVFRHGSFYLVGLLSIFSILMYQKFFGFNKHIKLKYLNFLFIFSLVFFISKNLLRISKSELNFFPNTIFEINEIEKNYEMYGDKNLEILKPKGILCFYSSYLCSHETPINIKIIKYGNYFVTKF